MDIDLNFIVIFLSFVLVAFLYFSFRFRTRQIYQETLRAALDKGLELTPEMIESLGERKPHKNADLRRGIIGIGIGLGFAVFGLTLGEEDAIRPLLAVSAFPFMIGLAYLGLWKFRE